MGTYTGTDGDDDIMPSNLSPGVVADPAGTKPGDAEDTLIGNDGRDVLYSGRGDDWLIGGEGGDTLDGGGGNDILDGGADDDGLGGEGGDDRLIGGEGSDLIDGGGGVDRMEGGSGDDVYVVSDPGDVAFEDTTDPSGGVDRVEASVSYTLSYGIENLVFGGAFGLSTGEDLNGIGNALNNRLDGNEGSNVLKGLNGDDKLNGLRGHDRLIGSPGDDELDGGQGQDELIGGKGDDELIGGGGENRLSGAGGDDAFVFAALKQTGDIITDFHGEKGENDRIVIVAAGFPAGLEAGGRLSRDQFQVSENRQALDADVRFIFRTTDQTLWFDENGRKDGGLTLVADLQSSADLHADDLWLV